MRFLSRLAATAAACTCLGTAAEPRIPEMDAQLEASLARGDYVFVWDLDRGTLGRGDPYRVMRTYYDGLVFALTEARRLIEPGTPAVVDLEPMQVPRHWDEAYAATLRSRETYLEGDAVTVNAEITRRDCGRTRSQVFYALSWKPREHEDWRAMRAARDAASCDLSKGNR